MRFGLVLLVGGLALAGRADAPGEVWFVPGWLRTETPQEGTLESLGETYAPARVRFWGWDGNTPLWPRAVARADEAVGPLVEAVAALPEAARSRLTLVGHSLGGRIVVRTLARLGARGLSVRQGVVLAAAIPHADEDVRLCGAGSRLPVLAVCNPDDVTLRYVYAMAEGGPVAAFGANGTLAPVANVRECVTPEDLTRQTRLEASWAQLQPLKDIANHHVHFYLEYLRRLVRGEPPSREVMVPQQYVNLEWTVMDAGVWWNVLEECAGWKLEQNIVTGHCRILDPGKVRAAWGGPEAMRAAFRKVKRQVLAR